jgi:excisionase family DNA binding protein
MSEIRLELPEAVLEAIAERAAQLAAELVLERVGQPSKATPYLSVDEAAELLRAKPQRIYDLLSSGRLSRFKDGSRVLVSRAELEAYLAGQQDVRAQVSLRKRK